METTNFEILYCNNKNNKPKQWQIAVRNCDKYSEIVTVYGGVNYRKFETTKQISEGKNVGKRNATTHYQQAIKEAQSKWNKKRDLEGYQPKSVFDMEKLSKELDEMKVEVKLPMLAQDYKKQKNKVKYPCYVQPKLDGFRCIYNTTTCEITTRQGKNFNIIKESGKLYDELTSLPKGFILDGELYTSKVKFETLGVLRKTKKLTEKEKLELFKIEYHIYDIIDEKLTFEKRNKEIKDLFNKQYEKIIYVPTFLVENEEEIKNFHMKFLEEGFEGTMVRNKESLYKIKQRSNDLLKYKDFEDAEFKIIDYTLEKDTSGADENLIVWIVEVYTNSSVRNVKVRPKGTKEERKELYKKCVENFDQFKGRNLWTKFFSFTADGSLRFPTTKCNTYTEYIRDDI
jgi:ATP-dependent DNA ligase